MKRTTRGATPVRKKTTQADRGGGGAGRPLVVSAPRLDKRTLAELGQRIGAPVALPPMAPLSPDKTSALAARAFRDARISIFAPARHVLTPAQAWSAGVCGVVFYRADIVTPLDPALLPPAFQGLFGGVGAPYVKLDSPHAAGQTSGGAVVFVAGADNASVFLTFAVHTFGPTTFTAFVNGDIVTETKSDAGPQVFSIGAGGASEIACDVKADTAWIFQSCTVDFVMG